MTVAALPSIDEAPQPARILVVDDIPANLIALEALLAPLGQEVVCASSGEAALGQLLRGDFAVILMDVQMPRLDGLETSRMIRARERNRYVPIIFITALSREAAHVTRGYEEGGVDYLLKPVDPTILRAKVTAFVELHQQRERVKAQVLQLAHQRAAHDELLRAQALEEQLLGIVGHDIRSPLSAVLVTAQVQLASPALPEPQRRAFERVHRGGKRISHIVDLLLDFTRARIGGGIPVHRRKIDLLALCQAVIDEVRAARPERQISLEGERAPLWGEWDGDRLAQVFANLLDNALKHGAEGSRVQVRIGRDAGGAARVSVHNDGEEIPREVRATLFEPFRRAAPSTASHGGGLGLGLFITRELVRAHGGEVEVRSGKTGTDFEVSLPLCVPLQASGSPRPEGRGQLSA